MLRFAFCLSLFWLSYTAHAQTAATVYVCTPCGYDCDKEEHSQPGKCAHCGMALVAKSSVVFKNLTPAEVCQTVAKNPKVILLDVRTPDEFNGKAPENFGRLKGAINIPVQELDKRLAELSKYKKIEIIVYCSHSHRSPRASYLLTQNGFTNVRNMSGGMSVWETSVSKATCSTALLVKGGKNRFKSKARLRYLSRAFDVFKNTIFYRATAWLATPWLLVTSIV